MTVLTTEVQTENQQQKQGNRNEKKNNCMDISSDKLARLAKRRHENGLESEISREKLNLF